MTLIELLVAFGIATALLLAATPNIASITRIFPVRSAARQVYAELQNLRMAAVTENRSYTFAVRPDGTSYEITVNGVTGSPISLEAASQGVTIAASNAIVFSARGTVSTGATVIASNPHGDATGISVSTAGRLRIQ